MSNKIRMLPHNIEAEAGVLGSLLIDPDVISPVVEVLRAEDFYRDAHRSIYEVILQLYNRREPADYLTICDELERSGKLEAVGGAGYIASLISAVPTSGNALAYARIVERTAILRRLIEASGEIAALAYEAEEDAGSVVERAEQLIFAISQRANSLSEDASLAELLSDYVVKLDQLHERRGQIVGVPSGFSDLDRLTGGFRKSDLVVLAARPSIGKTSCALSIALQSALWYNTRVGIFSLEMSQEQVMERLLAMESGINLQRLNTGNINDEEWGNIEAAARALYAAPIRVDGTSVLSPMQLRSRARRWVQEHGMDLIIVDYLQLMQPDMLRKQENRVQQIDEISRSLKLLARELNVPVLVLAQLSRAVESRMSKVPQLSDLRESGGIENNADIVMFIYREDVYNPEGERKGIADILVAKHRNGPTGQIVLKFERETTRFRNLDGLEAVEPVRVRTGDLLEESEEEVWEEEREESGLEEGDEDNA